jgi:glycosyltransferase involved in cell wall biosynthesis
MGCIDEAHGTTPLPSGAADKDVKRRMRVLALVKYDTLSASTRQRFVQYEPYLRAAGIEVEYSPLLGNDYLRSLVDGSRPRRAAMLQGYLRRIKRLFGRRDYDLLWVHSEFFPYLPGVAERLAVLAGGRPVVFDFDDAIFHSYDAHPSSLVRRVLGRKLVPALKRAEACCCGNPYVQDYAKRYCDNSIILPTVVSTKEYQPSGRIAPAPHELVIGWIGSPSTWRYMHPILPVLKELVEEHRVRVRVVGAGANAVGERFPGLDFVEWQEATEIREVQAMDIGIMPLPDEIWARGKSGYKLVQYMACGLPVIASPVGVNVDIVRDGVQGFLARDPAEWKAALVRLIRDGEMRFRMGAEGRKQVQERFSVEVHGPRLVELFTSLHARNPAAACR